MKIENIDQAAKINQQREDKLAKIYALWMSVYEDDRQLTALGVDVDEPCLQAAE